MDTLDLNTTTSDKEPDNVFIESDPFKLDIDDDDLIEVIDQRIKQSDDFYIEKKLKERQDRNKRYLFGDQLSEYEKDMKDYDSRYMDNIIYEGEATSKPIALSRLPEMTVKPGSDNEESKETAKQLGRLVNSDIRKRESRKVLGLAYKHLPVYYTSIIKAVWDNEKEDYFYKIVHPQNIKYDHTSSTNNPNDMDFIAEASEYSLKEVVMMFPKKADEFLEAVKVTKGGKGNKDNEKFMASKVKLWEVWFTWWESRSNPETGEKEWTKIDGTIWKYNKVLLAKMKNPYWDWEGDKKYFKMKKEEYKGGGGNFDEVSEDQIREMFFQGEGQEDVYEKKVFNNHFDRPRRPYIILGYDQWGEQPYDETSRIEQSIPLQDNVNKRGRQINYMNDTASGKHIFSTAGGMDKPKMREMDLRDPEQDLLVSGDLSKVHGFIPGVVAPAPLYTEQEQERQKGFAKLKAHSTTRGEKTSDVATTNQILREQDFGGIDDVVEDTINDAAEQMAGWAMQFIKLFYKEDKMKKVLGDDGETTFLKVTRDMVEDGMEVIVSASGTDKLQAKKEAFEKAKMKLTDPLTFFIDIGASDPIGRTEKLMMFMMAPELYLQKYVKKRDTQQMGEALNQQPLPGQAPTPPQMSQQQGEPVPIPAMPQGAEQFAGQGGGGGNPWPQLSFGGGGGQSNIGGYQYTSNRNL